ncbi:DNA-packaging protein [Sporosarcina sp. ANT_H38]|uniref:head-tail connector protein n=1 Tax=Sporosarcina sp. ANT_H38 TaxID=2597358 RepID=UPI0011F35BAB|nr:head-tail connector protein [Sporosarcina sp. ANT_H38]KAA0944157.1 DNA-packaging protein [Sporosarcina sp. ANT_H38]
MMLEDVKKTLRISSAVFDYEIQDLIDAGESDLRLSGIYFADTTNPLIKRALITYCKANFGYDNPEADRFQNSYDMLKMNLSLAGDFREPI